MVILNHISAMPVNLLPWTGFAANGVPGSWRAMRTGPGTFRVRQGSRGKARGKGEKTSISRCACSKDWERDAAVGALSTTAAADAMRTAEKDTATCTIS